MSRFRPRAPYRARWGGDFTREPEDVYRKKEAERATDLVRAASRDKYGTEEPPTPRQIKLDQLMSSRLGRSIESAREHLGEEPADEGGGGGFFGKVKDIGGRTLDVLDAAAETTYDIATSGPVGAPLNAAITAGEAGVALARGESPVGAVGSFGRRFAGADIAENVVGARGNPVEFGRRQLEDFESRPMAGQLAVSAFDPTNVAGAGAVTAGLRGAAAARRAGVGATLLRRAARANAVADRVQTRFAPEIAGGVLGGISGSLYSDDESAPLKGAAAGALLGAGARRLFPGSAANARLGGSVVEETGDAGKVTRVQSARDPGQSYEFRYRVVDANDLVLSHDPTTLAENPAYAQAIQPRNRTRRASQVQVEQMERAFDPQRVLAETGDLQNGVPIVGSDLLVESGNGRLMALRRAIDHGSPRYQQYVEELRGRLPEYGLSEEALAGMERPVLVRERITDVDRPAFAEEANTTTVMRMSPAEKARVESQAISDEALSGLFVPETATLDQALKSQQNLPIRRAFIRGLEQSEAAELLDPDGNLNQLGLTRLKAALFAKTFPGEAGARLTQSFHESADDAVKNVQNALGGALPALARLEAMIRAGSREGALSLADDLAAAVDQFARLKAQGDRIDEFILQSGMFNVGAQSMSPLQLDILRFLDANNRSPKKMREALISYAERAMDTPPPGQAGMFEGVSAPSKDDIWPRVSGLEPGDAPPASAGLFDESAAAADAASEARPSSTSPASTSNANIRAGSGADSVSVESSTPTESAASSASSVLDSETSKGSIPQSVPQTARRARNQAEVVIPPQLAKSAPRYSFGDKRFTLTFESDTDRALYIVAQPKPSKRDADFMELLEDAFPNRSPEEIRLMGKSVRERIKAMAKQADQGGNLTVPRSFDYDVMGVTKPPDEARVGPRRPDAQRAPAGAVGAPVRQADVEGRVADVAETGDVGPPRGPDDSGVMEPPGGPREPGEGRPQRSFGQDEAPEDLLLTKPREQYIEDVQRKHSTRRGRAGTRLTQNRGLRDERVEAARQMRDDTDHIVRELVDQQVDDAFLRLEKAGIRFVPDARDRSWLVEGTGATVDEIVEGGTDAGRAAREQLTPEQMEALEHVAELQGRWNRTAEFHGAEVGRVETETGEYFPRKVTARDIAEGRRVEKSAGAGRGGRSIGAQRGGPRTQTTVAEGTEAGIVYDHPKEALRGSLHSKARLAQDAAIRRMVEPLAVEAEPGFGFRHLSGNHPAFEKPRVIGSSEGGAAIMVRERMVFPDEIAEQLDELFDPKSITQSRPGRAAIAVQSVGIPLRAAADVSWLLNQGLGFLESSPQNFAKGMKAGFRTIMSASGSPEGYRRMVDDEVVRAHKVLEQAGIDKEPREWMIQRGMHWAADPQADEFLFPQRFQEALGRIPVAGGLAERTVQWSNETFARFLNYARFTLDVDLLERLVSQGLRGAELDEAMRSGIRSTNRMTGWTGTQPTGLERIGMFAPRFFRSHVEQIAAAATKGDIEGMVARRHLLKLAGVGAAVTFAANSLRGYETELDPRDHNFMRIRNVFGHDVSPYGSMATLFRGVAQTVGGSDPTAGIGPDLSAIPAFGRAKAGPLAGTIWTLASGETFDRRPVARDPFGDPGGTLRSLGDIAAENVPFSVQAALREGPLAGALSATGAQSSQVTPAERRDFARDEVSQELFNSDYDDLSGAEKGEVNRDERVSQHQDEVERRGLERTGDRSRQVEAAQTFRSRMEANGEFLNEGTDSAGNPFSGNDYREAYEEAAAEYRGALSVLDGRDRNDVVSGYFDLFDQAEMANGQTDYDKFRTLEKQYLEEHPDALERVDEVIGTRDDETMARFRIAREQAQEYYDIPPVRGMSVEDGHRANEILMIASAHVQAGTAPSRRTALAMMADRGEILTEEIAMALRASRLGSNPERKHFRLEHEEFRTFYSDAPGVSDLGADFPVSTASRGGSRSVTFGRGRRRSGGGSFRGRR